MGLNSHPSFAATPGADQMLDDQQSTRCISVLHQSVLVFASTMKALSPQLSFLQLIHPPAIIHRTSHKPRGKRLPAVLQPQIAVCSNRWRLAAAWTYVSGGAGPKAIVAGKTLGHLALLHTVRIRAISSSLQESVRESNP